MIKDDQTRDELKQLARELYAIGERVKATSTKVALNETSKDGDELFRIGANVQGKVLDIARIARFRMVLEKGGDLKFYEWDEPTNK